jgi:hypothetical protein
MVRCELLDLVVGAGQDEDGVHRIPLAYPVSTLNV